MTKMPFDIENKFLNPICIWVNMKPDINPIYGSMDRPCPNDSKNL